MRRSLMCMITESPDYGAIVSSWVCKHSQMEGSQSHLGFMRIYCRWCPWKGPNLSSRSEVSKVTGKPINWYADEAEDGATLRRDGCRT